MTTILEDRAVCAASFTLPLKTVKAAMRRLKPCAVKSKSYRYVDIQVNDPNPLTQIHITREGDGVDFIATDGCQMCIAHFPCEVAGGWPEEIGLLPDVVRFIQAMKGKQVTISAMLPPLPLCRYIRVEDDTGSAMAHILPERGFPKKPRRVIGECSGSFDFDLTVGLPVFTQAMEKVKANENAVSALAGMKNGIGLVVYSSHKATPNVCNPQAMKATPREWVSLHMSDYIPVQDVTWPEGMKFSKVKIDQLVDFLKRTKKAKITIEIPDSDKRPLVIRDDNLIYVTMPISKRPDEEKLMAQHI